MHTNYPLRGVHGAGYIEYAAPRTSHGAGYIEYAAPRTSHGAGYIEYAAPHCHLNPDYFEVPASGLCVRDFALAIKEPLGVKDGWAVEVQSPGTGRRLRGSQWLPTGSAVQVQVVKLGADLLDGGPAALTTAPEAPADGGGLAGSTASAAPTAPAAPAAPVVPLLPPNCSMWDSAHTVHLVDTMRRMQRLLVGAHTAYVTVVLRPGAACVLGMAVERGSTDTQGSEGRFTCTLPWPANPSSHHWTATTTAAVGLAVAAAAAAAAADGSVRMHTDAVWAGATDDTVAARCRFVGSTNGAIAALRRACVARLRR
jgi:hypothetical protein